MSNIFPPSVPLGGVGPGSQPMEPDGGQLEYMEMPSEMVTYSMPDIPEPENLVGLNDAKRVLTELKEALHSYKVGEDTIILDITDIADKDQALINQVLGEGEVSAIGGPNIQAQEAVLAGVWRVRTGDDNGVVIKDLIEVADFPTSILGTTFRSAKLRPDPVPEQLPEGVLNASPLVVELTDHLDKFQPGDAPHVINLTLLPQTDEDIAFLGKQLGYGNTTILSRGYGNCRISSTGTNNIWWVQFFNSQDAIILNTIEIDRIPQVACAAQEDIDESDQRLGEILEVYLNHD
ncbi:MAG: hydrogenase expression/formation protein [Rhodomicrobium sp.]|nr:MAG: hydrogenase expression/formation protein [Rhodomicrobium sp.]